MFSDGSVLHLSGTSSFIASAKGKAQRYNGEISASSFPKWTQYSIQRPSERQKNIQAKVDELAWDRDKFLNAFGVQVYKFPVVANARILPAPTLQLDKICVPKEGKWNHEPFKFYEVNPRDRESNCSASGIKELGDSCLFT